MKDNPQKSLINIVDKAALFFFTVLVFFLPISVATIEISFGFIFLCAIIKGFLKKPGKEEIKTFFNNRINFAVLTFLVCIFFTIFARGSSWPKGFEDWYSKWGQVILLFYFAQVFLKKKHVKFLLLVLAASTFLVCVDAMYQKIVGVDFIRGFELVRVNSGNSAVSASFRHYNDFASFLVVTFFIVFGFFKSTKVFWQKSVFLLLFLLIGVTIAFTFSRGAWFALLIIYLYLMIFLKDKKSAIFSSIFLGMFIVLILSMPSLRERVLFTVGSEGDAGRFKVWKATLLMFKDSPIWGKGLGSFMSCFHQYTDATMQYAHNCYLQILAETGLMGLIPFLWFLKGIVWEGYKKVKVRHHSLFLGLWAGMLAFLIHSFFDTQLYSLRLYTLFWVTASFITIFLSEKELQENLSI